MNGNKDVSAVLERTGYKIPPYRLSHISKTVSKIVQILTSPSPVMMSVNEANIVLDIVKATLERGEQG
jgi:hypothetical protein